MRRLGSSNPVLGNLEQTARPPVGGAPGVYGQTAPTQYGPAAYPSVIQPGTAAPERPMTVDDVVSRTVILVLVTTVTAAFAWFTIRSGPLLAISTIGASIAGLVLVFVISFRRITNPFLICAYAILQGLMLGVVSRWFEQAYPGIVGQAVGATLAVFLGMAVLYKMRILRATPKFTKWVIGALIGVVAMSLINWMFSLFGHNLGYEYYAPNSGAGKWAIVFSLVCVAVGALTFVLDFAQVENGIRYGMPERFAWYCAFGMLVGLIYLYWQILRLLGYLRE